MDPTSWIDRLQHDLDALSRAGIADRDVAYALMATRSGHAIDEQLLAQADPIWRLAWLLNVRAPGLDLYWLVKGVLATDKVYWEVLPLAQLVDRLRELEFAASDVHGDVGAWLTTPGDQPELDCIRSAAACLDTIDTIAGPALRDKVAEDIAQVQACVERGDLLELASTRGPRF